MVTPRKKVVRTKSKRFSVSLSKKDYARLCNIAKRQQPPLSLTFVVNKALHVFMRDVKAGRNIPAVEVPEKKGQR
jgi:hypothetical protein